MSEYQPQTSKSAQSYFATLEICPNPVFVIGCDRSGTTILGRSLGQHSHLWASVETDVLFRLFGEDRADSAFDWAMNRPGPSWLTLHGVARAEFLESLGLGLNALFTSRSGGKRWVDHTPGHTPMVKMLSAMYPGAKFIHMLRDGRRVVDSMINILNTFKPAERQRMIDGGYVPSYVDFQKACWRWRSFVEAALHFEKENPQRCLTVLNEQAVADPARAFGEMFEFIGVPFENGPIEFFSSNRINSSFRPDSRDSKWIRHMSNPWDSWSAERRKTFADVAGPTMTSYGLATSEELELSQYDRVVCATRQAVEQAIPASAKVGVLSKGDPQLIELGPRHAIHFPLDADGEYGGGNPEDSAEALRQLEALCAQGTEYLVIPESAFWWLDYYQGFRDRLNSWHPPVLQSDECAIYQLRATPAAARTTIQSGSRSLPTA